MKNILYGQGTCIFTDGSKYDGKWRKGRPHGDGAYTVDGKVSSGKWMCGVKVK